MNADSPQDTSGAEVSVAAKSARSDPVIALDSLDALDSLMIKKQSKWRIRVDRTLWLNILYVATWSYLGVLARKACEKLCTVQEPSELWQSPVVYSIFFGSSVFGSEGFFLANILGCVVMGLMSKIQPLISHENPYLYVGITTGFCGCLTTFATWNQNLSRAAARTSTFDTTTSMDVPFSTHMGRMCWFDAYFLLFIQFVLYCVALEAGHLAGETLFHCIDGTRSHASELALTIRQSELAIAFSPRSTTHSSSASHDAESVDPRHQEWQQRSEGWAEDLLPETTISRNLAAAESAAHAAAKLADDMSKQAENPNDEGILHIFVTVGMMILLTVLSWLMCFVLDDGEWWKSTARCMVFAPAGALVRYTLSLYNKNCGYVKWFTLMPNVVGSALNAIIFSRLGKFHSHSSWYGEFATGFCGSLSTVSTFVNECSHLTREETIVYAGLSFGLSQLMCSLINSFASECSSHEYYYAASDIIAGEFLCHVS